MDAPFNYFFIIFMPMMSVSIQDNIQLKTPAIETLLTERVNSGSYYFMETWKSIFGTYEVSNLGNVRSTGTPYKTRTGTMAIKKPKTIAQTKDSFGYLGAAIIYCEKQKRFLVHRLVATAFIPNAENKRCVNHINGVKTDNRLENLEWVTHSENSKHSFAIGLQCNKGEKHPTHKFTEAEVLQIRELKGVMSQRSLAKKHNVSKTAIQFIMNKKTWSHI